MSPGVTHADLHALGDQRDGFAEGKIVGQAGPVDAGIAASLDVLRKLNDGIAATRHRGE